MGSMKFVKELKMQLRLLRFIPFIVTLPSVMIGVIAMRFHGVPVFTYGQNIFCLVITGIISYFVISAKAKGKFENFANVTPFLGLLLLIFTLFGSGFQEVHRWVSIGPINFYVSSIILPCIMIGLWRVLQGKEWWISVIITACIALILTVQPDASQLTAFGIPMIIFILSKEGNKLFRFGIAGLLSVLIVFSWVFLDSLPPVSYVENIIRLVAEMGTMWLVFGITSLVILPLPFILFPPPDSKLLSFGLGIYFAAILLSTQFGNFPVPLMGYGISPILGYFLSITWLVQSGIKSPNITARLN